MRSVNIHLLQRWEDRINDIARAAWASQSSGVAPADAGKMYTALKQLCQRTINYDGRHNTGLTADAAHNARVALKLIEPILRPYAEA